MKKKPPETTAFDPRHLLWAGLVLFAFFCFSSINKPLTTDEVEFAGAALAIAKTGKPIYYMGDTPEQYWPGKDMWQKQEAPKPGFQYGLWHAPLYIYCVGLSYAIFGTADWAARLPNVIFLLATLWLLRGIIRHLVPRENADSVFGIVAFLYLVNPLLMQEGLMLDIDNTIVPFVSVLFFHEYFRTGSTQTHWLRRYGWLTVLMALSYWAKEFAGLYIAAALFVYQALRRQWIELPRVVAMTIAGTALFWATWWVFCKLTDLPVMYFIRFTILGKLAIGEGLLTTIAKASSWGNAWRSVLFSFFNTLLWVSPFYVALFLVVLGWRVHAFFKSKRPEAIDLLCLYVLAVVAATQIYRPSGWFLKYELPAHGLLIATLGVFLQEQLRGLKQHDWIAAALLALAVAAAQLIALDDPVLKFFHGQLRGLGDARIWGFYAAAAAALFALIKLTRRNWTLLQAAGAALAIGVVGANLALNWKQRAAHVTSISWNNYGEAGFTEAAAYLKSVLGPDDVPICRKDFGYYLYKDTDTMHRRWINPAVLVDAKTAEELVQNITAPGVRYIVLDRYSIRRETLPIIQQYYLLDKQIGSFYILRRAK